MSPEHDPDDAFVWLGPDATERLRQELNAAGPGAHVEIHGKNEHTTLYVVGLGALRVAGGGINEAHVCPPICPS